MLRNCVGFIKGFLPVKRRTSRIAALLVQLGLLLFLTFYSRSVRHLVSCSSEPSMFSLNFCTTLVSPSPLHLGDLCPSHLKRAAREAGRGRRSRYPGGANPTRSERSTASSLCPGLVVLVVALQSFVMHPNKSRSCEQNVSALLLLNGCLGTAEDNSNVISF